MKVKAVKRMSKKAIFAKYGILYNNGMIFCEYLNMWINLLLVNGNQKIGKGCYHFSTLPTMNIFNVIINGIEYAVKGTCKCNCIGCYATKGNYNFPSVIKALAIRTILIRNDLAFVENAIKAQIESESIQLCRIHASGDFDSIEYAMMWHRITKHFSSCAFWTYTKVKECENIFADVSNANIVKSVIHGFGYNYGHCEYILTVYNALKAMGKDVYICRCGIDKNQHCTNCKGCSKNEYVLFIEHSTEYVAENDPFYPVIVSIIENQKAM